MADAMKLLPCPFCGDDDPEITGENGWVWIACTTGSDCAGRGPDSDDEASAIEAWNRRASPPAPAREGEVERIVKALFERDDDLSCEAASLILSGSFGTALTAREEDPAEGAGEILDLLTHAKDAVHKIAAARRSIGPLATQAQTAGHAISQAIKHLRARTSEPAREAVAWKDQRLTRIERVKMHRVAFGSDLKTALDAVDEHAAVSTILDKIPAPATADKLRDIVQRCVNALDASRNGGEYPDFEEWEADARQALAELTEEG